MNEKELKEAAKWLWARKDNVDWWNYLVLTDENPDPSTLSIGRNKAFQIFTILEERRLILPITVRKDNFVFPAYKLNYNKGKEWEDLITKKGIFRLHIFPFAIWVFKKTWIFVLWVLSLVIASSLQAVCNKIIDNLFK